MVTVTRHCDRCAKQTPHSAETMEDQASSWVVYTCSWCWTVSRHRATNAATAERAAAADVVLHRRLDRK
jgi:hypothetical protein